MAGLLSSSRPLTRWRVLLLGVTRMTNKYLPSCSRPVISSRTWR